MGNDECNLCTSTIFEHHQTTNDFFLGREDVNSDFVRCTTCGLIFQSPRPSREELRPHYPDTYTDQIDHPENQQESWIFNIARRYGLQKRYREISRYKDKGRILDIGSSSGHFLSLLHNNPDWDAYGIEPSDYAAQLARKKYNLNVQIGTLNDVSFPDRFFDAVTMWDVLEHVQNPQQTLLEINRILHSQGFLVIRVPNAYSLDATIFGPHWAGYDAPRHLYIFSPITLQKMLSNAGFVILDKHCRLGSYTAFILSLNFLMIKNGLSNKLRRSIMRALNSPMMKFISVPPFFIYSLTMRGPLLTIVAQKGGEIS